MDRSYFYFLLNFLLCLLFALFLPFKQERLQPSGNSHIDLEQRVIRKFYLRLAIPSELGPLTNCSFGQRGLRSSASSPRKQPKFQVRSYMEH
jgi:hypothetical protein